MISVSEYLPEIKDGLSVPVRFVVDGEIYEGTYHENGWFYSRGWMCGKQNKGEMMARGPSAECRMQTWGELPKHKASSWEYLSSNDRVEGRDAASSRRVPSHDGLCGAVDTESRT